jgi:hypothetical protein
MAFLLRLILFLAALGVIRAVWRAGRRQRHRDRDVRPPAGSGRYGSLSDQEVSDADFEEIP